MKFETAMQTAARLGVTVRAVQKWAKEGKLPGAKKVGRDWAIPFGATVSAGTDLPGGAEESPDLSGLPFPLFQLPYIAVVTPWSISRISPIRTHATSTSSRCIILWVRSKSPSS